ncbi:MAG: metalloregulator ArsR/SmtB family transcription factor [Pseudomonadales bacterium]
MSNENSARAAQLTPVFAALGDKTRLHIVERLATGETRSIAQLADGLDISHQGVTKHLKVLERCGLVRAQRVGRERRYSAELTLVREARSYLDEVAQTWDEALQRLRDFVEE